MNALLVRSVVGLFLFAGGLAVPGVHAADPVASGITAAPVGLDSGSMVRLEVSLDRSMRAEVLRRLRVQVRATLPRPVAGTGVEAEASTPVERVPRPRTFAGPAVADCGAASSGGVSASC